MMKNLFIAAFVTILLTMNVNASKMHVVQHANQLQVSDVPPAILAAFNNLLQQFGSPTSVEVISFTRHGGKWVVVATLTFANGTTKTLIASFTPSGKVLTFTLS